MSRYARFMKHVRMDVSGCWIWTGALGTHGYGRFSLGAKSEGNISAHRWSYEHHKAHV